MDNSYYFKKKKFLWVISLHPKFYKPVFYLNVKFAPNYTEKLILIGIATTTFVPCFCNKYLLIYTWLFN
jgi:hypothetical protein